MTACVCLYAHHLSSSLCEIESRVTFGKHVIACISLSIVTDDLFPHSSLLTTYARVGADGMHASWFYYAEQTERILTACELHCMLK